MKLVVLIGNYLVMFIECFIIGYYVVLIEVGLFIVFLIFFFCDLFILGFYLIK